MCNCCDAYFATTAQIAGLVFIWLGYGFQEILKYCCDMISICPWLKISLNLVPCRDTQAAWRKQSGGLQTTDFGSVSARAPDVSPIISILSPCYFHPIAPRFAHGREVSRSLNIQAIWPGQKKTTAAEHTGCKGWGKTGEAGTTTP